MVDYWKALKRGLVFGINPKRWLQFFVLDLIFISIGLTIILPNLNDVLAFIMSDAQDIGGVFSMAGFALSLILVFAVWMLVRLWLTGSIIHQSYKGKAGLSESYGFAGRKYLHLLVAIIIISAVSFIVNFVPYIGAILTIIVSWIFFFVFQGIVVGNTGFKNSIRNSWSMFRNNPLQVFLAWLLITIVTVVIYLIFSIPAMFMFFGLFASLAPMYAGAEFVPAAFMDPLSQAMLANLPALIAVGVIALLGFAVSQAFALKAQTEFYLQMKKKK